MSKSLDQQYVTFYAILDDLPIRPEDGAGERASRVHQRAYALVEARYKDFPSRHDKTYDDVEVDVHQLCDDDTEVVERDGKMAWGVCFVAHRNLRREHLLPLRDLVVKAYEDAGAEHGMPVRFAGAQRFNVLRVTETMDVDFESESPSMEVA
jgi:hypothetical protein